MLVYRYLIQLIYLYKKFVTLLLLFFFVIHVSINYIPFYVWESMKRAEAIENTAQICYVYTRWKYFCWFHKCMGVFLLFFSTIVSIDPIIYCIKRIVLYHCFLCWNEMLYNMFRNRKKEIESESEKEKEVLMHDWLEMVMGRDGMRFDNPIFIPPT